MKQLPLPSLSALLCALAVACGGDATGDDATDDSTDDATDDTTDDGPDADPGEPLINGEPASVFYGPFVYDELETYSEGVSEFPLTDGKNIYIVQFYLLADETYIMYYADGEGELRFDGYSMAVAPEDKLRLTGAWQVTGSTLELGSLLACDGLSFNGERALQCQIVTPPGSPAATEGTALALPYGNLVAPDDSRWDEYN